MILNKKEYNDTGIFKKFYIEEYCNLNIYPHVGVLEREAQFLSDIAEAYELEGIQVGINIYGENEGTQFLRDNISRSDKFETFFSYIDDSIKKIELLKLGDFVLAKKCEYLQKLYPIKLNFHEKVLYSKDSTIFDKHFWYYYNNDQFIYDNLICYTMIVKNAGPILEKVLTDNLPIIDRWCILDTGSTDGTQDVIRRILKHKKGNLYEEPFVDFKVSRNRCLELAQKNCKFIIMLDDTYSIKGDLRSFLNTVRGDQFSDSFSLLIQSEDTEYYSNRIIKSTTGLRYIHTIHEVITDTSNINVTVPVDKAFILDNRTDYMEKRTMDRKQFDLQLLFKEVEDDPNDPRALYYIAQTYGCIGDEVNKAKYFELRINHPVQGYFQEKIDACFELARTYNFKINPITKEPLTVLTKLDDQCWKICEDLYIQAYNLDPNRPDSLYFIGIHYYLNKEFNIAYEYFKKAFEVGYPLNSQYSLKPTLSFHFLPKFLSELCYVNSNFQLGMESAKLFLTSSKFNNPSSDSWNLMSNWYKIHENLCKLPPRSEPKRLDKPIFCIVTDGGWEPWTGSDIETKGLGGSETWVISMAKHISRSDKYHVVVFCKTNKPEFYEKVGYNPIEMFHEFIATTEVEYLIVSRFTEYIPVAIHGYAKNIGVIFHDNLSPELIIPVHEKIKCLWGLTQWHAGCIKNIFPQFKVNYINYGIDSSKFHENPKIKNSFIYSSFPNRGLIVLLKMWPKIVKRYPDSTLHIYCNLEQEWVNQVSPDMMKEIKVLLRINKTGVTVHGWVSKSELAKAWTTAEYWLYPCIFEETFCLTALEAAISKTHVITNGLAALSETAKYGHTVPGNPLTPEWQSDCLTILFEIMKNGNNLVSSKPNNNLVSSKPNNNLVSSKPNNDHIDENWNYAKSLTWENQAIKILEDF